MADDGLVGDAGEGGDGHGFAGEAQVAEDSTGAGDGLQAGNNFQGTAARALSADAVGAVDFEGGVGFLITIRRDFDMHAVGINPEGDGFHRNGCYFVARELEVGLQQEVTDMLIGISCGGGSESKTQRDECRANHGPTSHKESVVLPDGS